MTINNQYKKLNIAFLVIVAPFLHLARRRNKLSAVLLSGGNNQAAGKTYVYEYDSRGNILSRKTYEYTTGVLQDTDVYLYSGDRLMSYDGSMEFQYDEIGNPTLYFNSTSSGDIYTFNWEKGRQLASGNRSGTSFSYTYDADGIRTSKTVGNTTYNYYTDGGQLQAMTISNGATVTTTMQFYYNASGTPVAFKYNGTLYYYLTNLQGDVIGIIDDYGVSAYYVYDAWGKIISTNSASNTLYSLLMANPLRYRGYIYDSETGFYYLQSRYYDSEVGRFINADGYVSTGQGVNGYNMYAYCGNNPVNRKDTSGQGWRVAIVVVAVVIAIVVVIANEVKDAVIDAQEGVNDYEKEVAKKDPIGALQGNNAKEIANQYQCDLYPNTYKFDNNQANAFKHAMWNAVMTDKIGAERAKKFADAHEAPYLELQPNSCEMDLFNNELGRQIAIKYAGQGYDVFAEKIQEEIIGGNAYVIEWDKGN